MGVSKVAMGSRVIMDLTQDTVTPETLLQGVTAHNARGEKITGALQPVSRTTAININVDSGITVTYYTLEGQKIDLTAAVTTIYALGGIVTVTAGRIPDATGTFTNFGDTYVFLNDGGTLNYNNYSELVTADDNLFTTADELGFAVKRS